MTTKLGWILAVAAAVATAPALAKDNENKWRFAAGSETGADFYVDPATFREHDHKGGASIRVDGKYVKPDGKAQLVIFEVGKEDCRNGIGVIRMLDMEGRGTSRNDFAFRVNSAASGIARVVCARMK